MKQKFEGMIQMPEFAGQNGGIFFFFYSVFLDAPEAVTLYPLGQCMFLCS